jgi:hypothetical protein
LVARVPLSSAVYVFERNLNLNEIMHKLVTGVPRTHVLEEDLAKLLICSAIIGKVLEKAKVRMLELDPKNIFRNDLDEYKLGACIKFLLPGTDLKNINPLVCDNVM